MTPISQCIVDAQDDVVIGGAGAPPGCTQVEMEPTNTPTALGAITINSGGTLVIGPPTNESVASIGGVLGRLLTRTAIWAGAADAQTGQSYPPVAEICVEGTLEFGTAQQPITSANKIELKFLGDRLFAPISPKCQGFQKGIDVVAGGTLRMFGKKGVPSYGGISWTYLNEPAGKPIDGAKVAPPPLSDGHQVLKLAGDVTKGESWAPDDWITVATTSYSPFETEFVQIQTVKADGKGGSEITLKQPLKYYHFGSEAPSTGTCVDKLGKTEPASFCDGATKNYGVDERAEVGLISRDIKLTAGVPDNPNSLHWGGEIMIHKGFKEASIQGVEIEKFGKDQLSSYPIHFHQAGDVTSQKPLIDANSVHHSYNKCVTVHSTQNLTVSNMVCARVVGHAFYEQYGDEYNTSFENDLALGAMSNNFDINPVTTLPPNPQTISRDDLIAAYWWTGDYLTNNDPLAPPPNGYDGFNVPNTGDQTLPVTGACDIYDPGNTGGTIQQGYPSAGNACGSGQVYNEPSSGFWIINPTTNLKGNAVAGCQGAGKGFYWVTPNSEIAYNGKMVDIKFAPLGTFSNNRASACYSGFYDEQEINTNSNQLFPYQNGDHASQPLIANLDGMTATRNRFRGVWLRPTWFVVKNSRFASNRENVSLVTSGGVDGNAPGVWAMLADSVVVGSSQNNVDRFGPCPTENQLGQYTGAKFGCIDHTPPAAGTAPHSGDDLQQGYDPPSWNQFGYMLYDGPVRVVHDRFVNFNYDRPVDKGGTGDEFSSQLDTADKQFLDSYSSSGQTPTGKKPFVYEGDAVFGWFQSNQSSYPTGTVSRELLFENTNLRHQIYTEVVGVNTEFNDGDKNTAVIDEDGTLSGLQVLSNTGQPNGVHPISLNNLPFNATSNALSSSAIANSVDECLSVGGQNSKFEGRESSLMSAASMGTLEFSTLFPWAQLVNVNTPQQAWKALEGPYPGAPNTHTQLLTFARDDVTSDGKGGSFHPSMTLHSRNGLGIWEPKVASGYGYTVTAAGATSTLPKGNVTGLAGVGSFLDVGVADIVKPNVSLSNPFYVRLGICYTNTDTTHPADASKFVITRGYKSFNGGNFVESSPAAPYWHNLACNNLDDNNRANVPVNGSTPTCPSASTVTLTSGQTCNLPGKLSDDKKSCVYSTDTLQMAADLSGLSQCSATTTKKCVVDADCPTGETCKPAPNLDKYYYDPATGMLYFYVAQREPNPIALSPLGSCTGASTDDPSCPDVSHGETYWACPAPGCTVYTVNLTDTTYNPGPSNCTPYDKYVQNPPANQDQLYLVGTKTPVKVKSDIALDDASVPFYQADTSTAPTCDVTQPTAAPTGPPTITPTGMVPPTPTPIGWATSTPSPIVPPTGTPTRGTPTPTGRATSTPSPIVPPTGTPTRGTPTPTGRATSTPSPIVPPTRTPTGTITPTTPSGATASPTPTVPTVTPSPGGSGFTWILDGTTTTNLSIPQAGMSYGPGVLTLQDSQGRFCTAAGLQPIISVDFTGGSTGPVGVFPSNTTQQVGIANIPGRSPAGTYDLLIQTRGPGCKSGTAPTTLRMPSAITYS